MDYMYFLYRYKYKFIYILKGGCAPPTSHRPSRPGRPVRVQWPQPWSVPVAAGGSGAAQRVQTAVVDEGLGSGQASELPASS